MSAEARFDFGGFLLMENVPTSPPISVGIDLHEWTIDKNFRGFKMIPPGLHFIHYTHPQAFVAWTLPHCSTFLFVDNSVWDSFTFSNHAN